MKQSLSTLVFSSNVYMLDLCEWIWMDEKQGVWEIIFVYFLRVLFTTFSINDCLLVSYDWSYRLKKKKPHFGEGAAHSALTFLYIDFFFLTICIQDQFKM